jgi:hypothetical protein
VHILKDERQEKTLVKDLKKGDQVIVAGDKTSTLKCLVKIKQDDPTKLSVLENDLRITPRHPVFINEQW